MEEEFEEEGSRRLGKDRGRKERGGGKWSQQENRKRGQKRSKRNKKRKRKGKEDSGKC